MNETKTELLIQTTAEIERCASSLKFYLSLSTESAAHAAEKMRVDLHILLTKLDNLWFGRSGAKIASATDRKAANRHAIRLAIAEKTHEYNFVKGHRLYEKKN